MKKSDWLLPIAILTFILIIFVPIEKDVKPFEYSYVNGQVLYPDYGCIDTLIVTNAEALNYNLNVLYDQRLGNMNVKDDKLLEYYFYKYCTIIKPHYCKYTFCPFKQEEKYFKVGCGECFPDEDCWKIDSIHFYHPELDYDGCDSIFNSLKTEKCK